MTFVTVQHDAKGNPFETSPGNVDVIDRAKATMSLYLAH
jgi:hypothetical protein